MSTDAIEVIDISSSQAEGNGQASALGVSNTASSASASLLHPTHPPSPEVRFQFNGFDS